MADQKNNTPSPAVKTIKAKYTAVAPSMFSYKGNDYLLHQNEEYELPADCLHVQSLIGQKHLVIIK